ncbi:MAG: hypothetical protein JSR73_19385 [Proteobacteria bacterium]|nr:hypothetical protein [Pseudomonadota bacterium]
MRMAALATGLLICVAASGAAPPPLTSEADVRQFADAVMAFVAKDDTDAAFAKLKEHWPLPANEIDSLATKTLAARNTVADRYGAVLNVVLLKQEAVGDSLLRYTYLERRRHHPLRWLIYFYRSDTEWFVDGTSWDDQIQSLFTK